MRNPYSNDEAFGLGKGTKIGVVNQNYGIISLDSHERRTDDGIIVWP